MDIESDVYVRVHRVTIGLMQETPEGLNKRVFVPAENIDFAYIVEETERGVIQLKSGQLFWVSPEQVRELNRYISDITRYLDPVTARES